jgi:NAD(P)-dependent dehydrogenase (short-subunit alcohol dehydrogenase family)
MVYNLRHRAVLITGGSKGLGAVLCRKFAAEGCNVAINFNSDANAAEHLAQELQASSGIKVITVKAVCDRRPFVTMA